MALAVRSAPALGPGARAARPWVGSPLAGSCPSPWPGAPWPAPARPSGSALALALPLRLALPSVALAWPLPFPTPQPAPVSRAVPAARAARPERCRVPVPRCRAPSAGRACRAFRRSCAVPGVVPGRRPPPGAGPCRRTCPGCPCLPLRAPDARSAPGCVLPAWLAPLRARSCRPAGRSVCAGRRPVLAVPVPPRRSGRGRRVPALRPALAGGRSRGTSQAAAGGSAGAAAAARAWASEPASAARRRPRVPRLRLLRRSRLRLRSRVAEAPAAVSPRPSPAAGGVLPAAGVAGAGDVPSVTPRSVVWVRRRRPAAPCAAGVYPRRCSRGLPARGRRRAAFAGDARGATLRRRARRRGRAVRPAAGFAFAATDGAGSSSTAWTPL